MGAERQTWIDIGRGTCIILVTVLHTTFVVEAALGGGTGIWPVVDSFLQPLRMPLFFFIAGMLGATAVTRPLALTRRRTVGLLYLYVLWSLVQLTHLAYWVGMNGGEFPGRRDIIVSLMVPTGLWFFWALAVFFLVARFARVLLGRGAVWILVPLGALAMLEPVVSPLVDIPMHPAFGGVFFPSVFANAVWYFLGLHGRSLVGRLRRSAHPVVVAIGVAAYIVGWEVARRLGFAGNVIWMFSLAAIVLAVQLFAVLPLTMVAARTIAAVGRRTLPIYAMQWFFMHILSIALVDNDLLGWVPDRDLTATIVTPLLAGAVVAVSWGLGGALSRGPFAWAVEAPRWVVGRAPAVVADATAPVSGSVSRARPGSRR